MSGPGRYLINSGTQAVNMLTSNPSPGVLNTHYSITGGGTVTWP